MATPHQNSSDREAFGPIATGCIARKLRMLNRAVSAIYDAALRPYAIKVSQMNVLVAVAVLGPVPSSEVAKRLMLEKSTLSRNLDRMHERRWIHIADADDGRAYELTLAPAGRALLKEVMPKWRAAQREASQLIGAEGVDAVHAMTDRLAEGRA